MKNLVILIVLFVACQANIFAQVYDTLGSERRTTMAEQAIKDLKNGVLVVRLKTGDKKLEALRRVAKSPNVSNSDKARFQQKVKDHQEKVRLENEWLVSSLKKNYSFSEMLFMLDTSAHELKMGKQNGVFLDENLQPNPNISLSNKPYLVLYHGQTISRVKSSSEGLVILDAGLQELVDPFPFFIGITTIKRALGKFFNKKGEDEFFDEMVEKLQKRLDDYHEEVIEK